MNSPQLRQYESLAISSVKTKIKNLWKLSILIKITLNQLFPSSLRIRWKLESQSSLKSVCRNWQKWKTCENCLFHQHGWWIQLGKWKIDKNCYYIIDVFGEKQLLFNTVHQLAASIYKIYRLKIEKSTNSAAY